MTGNRLRQAVANWQMGLYDVLTLQNGVDFRIADRVRTAQLFVFRLHLMRAADLEKTLKLEEQVGLVLQVRSPRLARNLGFVDLEIPLPRPYHRTLPVKTLPQKGGLWVALGQTATGTPVYINLGGNRTCHALISGMTGSGKTIAQHLLAWSLAMNNEPADVAMILIDGKGAAAWWGFDREAHLAHPVIGETSEAVAALTWCVAEVDRRKHNGQRMPRLFVIVDEVRELIEVGGQPVAEAIQRIAALGRELGVHVVVATQHAMSDAVGGSITKANLPLRLTGRVSDAATAYTATGIRESGAQTLQGNGDFLVTVAGAIHRVQVALVGNRELGLMPRVDQTPTLDFGELDPARVLDVTAPAERAKPIEDDVEAVAYALATDCGIPTLRERYGPMGAKRATRIRDFARAMRGALERLGYGYPLPVTD